MVPRNFIRSLMAAALMLGMGSSAASADLAGGTFNAYLYRGGIWRTALIPVCWEDDGFLAEKQVVRRYVAATWERESGLAFTGWARCLAGQEPGIHIGIEDSTNAPHVIDLGSNLNGRSRGMVLNFTFANWPCSLPRDICIGAIAVHEFGHALAFAHEQNRPDTPKWCREPPQGGNGDIIEEEWDAKSVMNYCSVNGWNNYGSLSAGDVSALRRHYPMPQWKAVGDGEKLLAAAWIGDHGGVKHYLTPETFDTRSPEGLNALMMAADKCHLEIARFILNSGFLSGPDINARNTFNNSALEIARGTPRELREQGIVRPRCPDMVPLLLAFGGQ